MFQRTTPILIISCVASSSTWAGDTLHVPADYPTIQAAIVASIDGDTIEVAPGSYAQPIHFLGKSVLVTSSNPNSDSVVDNTRIMTPINFLGTETEPAEVRGFTLYGEIVGNGAHATISKCKSSSQISRITGGIKDCELSSPECCGGWGIFDCSATIERCTIRGYAIAVISSGGLIRDSLITHNGTAFFSATGAEATNCTIVGNQGAFSHWYGTARNCIVWNNWVDDITPPGSVSTPWTCVQDSNNCTNPQFVDSGHWDFNGSIYWVEGTDYRLLPDSPLIDAGDPDVMFDPTEIDLDGNTRVFNGRIDMGAYEAQLSGCGGDDFDSDGLADECDPDFDGDGVANPEDECGYTLPGAEVDLEGRPRGDLNDDCRNDLADFAIFQRGITGA